MVIAGKDEHPAFGEVRLDAADDRSLTLVDLPPTGALSQMSTIPRMLEPLSREP
jgi:hypothetical protein